MGGYLDAMSRYATFTGTSTRKQFWLYVLVFFIGAFIAAVVDGVLWPGGAAGSGFFFLGYAAIHLLPSIALQVRRIRDAGLSPWWVLAGLTPFVGPLVLFVFSLLATSPGNAAPPTYPAAAAEPSVSAPAAAPQAPPPVAPSPVPNLDGAALDRLERLAALRAVGVITDDEFNRMKHAVLGKAGVQ